MNAPLTLALLTTLLAPAAAQQTARVTLSPVTVDGVTTPNGIAVIDGKPYVSLDALRARGVTVLRPNSLGVYAFPRGTGPAIKLAGCRGEWLFNGTLRVRVLDTEATPAGWNVKTQMQAAISDDSIAIDKVLDLQKVIGVSQSGKVYDPSKSPFQRSTLSYPWARKTETLPIEIRLADADGAVDNPLQKLVLPSRDKDAPGALTVDLTCTRAAAK